MPRDRYLIYEHILWAIVDAHEIDILHRDLNPNNVLIFKNKIPKSLVWPKFTVAVSDFGLGKGPRQGPYSTGPDAACFGQEHYTSPEQFENLADATHLSDVFALGRLLTFVMTGKVPRVEYLHSLTDVAKKACSVAPSDRYGSVQALAKAFNTKARVAMGGNSRACRRGRGSNNNKGLVWGSFLKTEGEYKVNVLVISEYTDRLDDLRTRLGQSVVIEGLTLGTPIKIAQKFARRRTNKVDVLVLDLRGFSGVTVELAKAFEYELSGCLLGVTDDWEERRRFNSLAGGGIPISYPSTLQEDLKYLGSIIR